MNTFESVPFRERYYETIGGLYDQYLLHAVSASSPGLIRFENDFDEEIAMKIDQGIILGETQAIDPVVVWMTMPSQEESAAIAAESAFRIQELTVGLNQETLNTLFMESIQILLDYPPAGVHTNDATKFKEALINTGDPLSGKTLSDHEIENMYRNKLTVVD